MCVRQNARELAKSYFKDLTNIELFESRLYDLWIRDSGPVFVIDKNGAKCAVDFNFNRWGEKQEYDNDGELAATIAEHCNVPVVASRLPKNRNLKTCECPRVVTWN
jgi:agmatine deiminase